MNQPIFKRERQALSDAEVDEGILLYEGGGKRPKVPYSHGRQYAPDNTISTLETAKLIKFQRTEQYPNGASVAAYILTKKGETWIDNAIKLEWAMEGQTTTRLMLLAFFATLPDDIRQVALNALHETDAS